MFESLLCCLELEKSAIEEGLFCVSNQLSELVVLDVSSTILDIEGSKFVNSVTYRIILFDLALVLN